MPSLVIVILNNIKNTSPKKDTINYGQKKKQYMDNILLFISWALNVKALKFSKLGIAFLHFIVFSILYEFRNDKYWYRMENLKKSYRRLVHMNFKIFGQSKKEGDWILTFSVSSQKEYFMFSSEFNRIQ